MARWNLIKDNHIDRGETNQRTKASTYLGSCFPNDIWLLQFGKALVSAPSSMAGR